jgi:hypothetical protein
MSKESRQAADAIKFATDMKEQTSKRAKKQATLDMEDFADNKNDPTLKRALNFINRIGTGRQMLYNFLVDAYENKDIKEARKVASEIIRNVNPNESIKTQLNKISNNSGIRDDAKRSLKTRKKYQKSTYSRGGLTRKGHTDHRAKGLFK